VECDSRPRASIPIRAFGGFRKYRKVAQRRRYFDAYTAEGDQNCFFLPKVQGSLLRFQTPTGERRIIAIIGAWLSSGIAPALEAKRAELREQIDDIGDRRNHSIRDRGDDVSSQMLRAQGLGLDGEALRLRHMNPPANAQEDIPMRPTLPIWPPIREATGAAMCP